MTTPPFPSTDPPLVLRGAMVFDSPGENAQEIVRMVGLGMSPGSALLASTAWAADLVRIAGETGRIQHCLAADLVVLDADPLENIDILTQPAAIRAVIQGGRIVRSTLPGSEIAT